MGKITPRDLFDAVEEFRRLDSDAPTRLLSTFLLIADKPGISMTEIRESMSVDGSSVTRSVAALLDWKSPRQHGLDLVYYEPSRENRKFHLCYLTPKGEKLKTKLVN